MSAQLNYEAVDPANLKLMGQLAENSEDGRRLGLRYWHTVTHDPSLLYDMPSTRSQASRTQPSFRIADFRFQSSD